MLAAKEEDQTDDQSDNMFGQPPLLKGEDRKRYFSLRAALAAAVKPTTVFDWMMVVDQTDKYWEEMRYKRNCAALIESAYVEAFEHLVGPFCTIPDVPSAIARDYY